MWGGPDPTVNYEGVQGLFLAPLGELYNRVGRRGGGEGWRWRWRKKLRTAEYAQASFYSTQPVFVCAIYIVTAGKSMQFIRQM